MKIFKAFVLIFAMVFLFTGCTASQSLSDLTIVQAVGVDYEKSKTSVTLQYLNLAKGGGTTDALSTSITSVAKGNSNGISNAISSVSSKLAQELFFGQNKVIIIGKSYVDYGIENSLDYFLRSVDSRPDVIVAMSDKSAESVVKCKERDARIPAENVFSLIETGEKNGFSVVVSVNELLNLYADKTSDIYLPVLSADKDACSCKGIAIFSNEKYAYTFNQNQSLGFLLTQNKVEAGFITVKDEKLGNVTLEIISSKAKNRVVKTENGYEYFCDIKMELTLDEVENGITSAIDESKIKRIERLVNKKINSICESTFNDCVENESDVLQLGRCLAKSNSKEYELVKNNWHNEMHKITPKISLKSNLAKVNDTALRG